MIANLVVSELDDIIYYGPPFEDIHVITSRHAHTTFYPFSCCTLLYSTRLDLTSFTKQKYHIESHGGKVGINT